MLGELRSAACAMLLLELEAEYKYTIYIYIFILDGVPDPPSLFFSDNFSFSRRIGDEIFTSVVVGRRGEGGGYF